MNTVHSPRHLWCSFQRSSCHLSSLHQFCDHVDVEDVKIVEKASFHCRLNHTNRSWSAGSNPSLCLVLLSSGMNELTFPCSFLKTLQHLCCFLEVLSLCHRTRLKIWVATFHRYGVLVARPLVIWRSVRDVNRAKVVQIFAISSSPSYCHL